MAGAPAQQQVRTCSAVAAFANTLFDVTGVDEPYRVAAARVSANFFTTLGTSVTTPPFPNLLANFDLSHVRYQLQTTNYDLQNPYALQFNLSIQRSLPVDWVLNAGYSGFRGLHLFRIGDANLTPFTIVNSIKVYQPQPGRMNPNFASITQRITDAQLFYNALQLSARKRSGSPMACTPSSPPPFRARSTMRAA